MKKSYLKILILELVLILIMFFNIFIINKMSQMSLLGILIVGLLILNIMLGVEKNKYRYSTDSILIILIYLILAFMVFYVLGLFTSFNRVDGYLSSSTIVKFILPLVLSIFIVEIFRNNLLRKSEGSKLLIVLTTFLFILVDLVLLINPGIFTSSYNIFMFCACYLIPIIVKNIFITYLCSRMGYKSCVVYRLISELYIYLIPIVPNLGDYMNAMFKTIMPAILMYIIYIKFKDRVRENVIVYSNQKVNVFADAFLILLVTVIIYLTSGYFTYYFVAIGSGSMEDLIHKGDLVVVKKLKEVDKKNVNIGDILAYKYGNTTIVHRIIDIYDRESFYVYTKGDANEKKDNYPIDKQMMKGTVKMVIPLMGYPTIFFSENF